MLAILSFLSCVLPYGILYTVGLFRKHKFEVYIVSYHSLLITTMSIQHYNLLAVFDATGVVAFKVFDI